MSECVPPSLGDAAPNLEVSADGGITLVRGLGSIINTMEASGRMGPSTARSLLQNKSTLRAMPSSASMIATKGTLPTTMSSMQRGAHVPLQGAQSMLQGPRVGLLAQQGSVVPHAALYMATTAGASAHRVWVDAVTCLPLPAVVVGARASEPGAAPAYNVLFANGPFISMTGRDHAALCGAPLATLFAHASTFAGFAQALGTGCMFAAQAIDIQASAPEAPSVVAYPVTEMGDGAPLTAHLLVFLPGATARDLAAPFLRRCVNDAALEAASCKLGGLEGEACVRVGLFAGAGRCDGVLSPPAAAPYHEALFATYQGALAARAAGRRPVATVPGALEVVQWLELFERCMTCAATA